MKYSVYIHGSTAILIVKTSSHYTDNFFIAEPFYPIKLEHKPILQSPQSSNGFTVIHLLTVIWFEVM